MISDIFIQFVEDEAETLYNEWIKKCQSQPLVKSFDDLDERILRDSSFSIYRHLSEYVDQPHKSQARGETFMDNGRHFREKEVPINETVFIIILERRNLWDHFIEHREISTGLEWQQVVGFWNRVQHFYDEYVYFTVTGYIEGSDFDGEEEKKSTVEEILHDFTKGVLHEV